jgi:transposase-like protein
MSKKDEAMRRARYTAEFKLEAVRLVKAGQDASVTAQVTLPENVSLAERGRGDVPEPVEGVS